MFPVFLPARVLSEAVTWVNDKISGDARYGGYFAPSYLTGQTGPGTLTPYNPVNYIHYGQPGHINHGPFVGKPVSSGWIDLYHDITMQKEYVKRIGSKKILWIPKKAAAANGIVEKTLSRITLGTYAGKFEEVNVYETNQLGTLEESEKGRSGGITLPPLGIIVGKGVYSKKYDMDLLKHEFGHKLQYDIVGFRKYYNIIGVNSLLSAYLDGKGGWNHDEYWIEKWANYLSREYFGSNGWDNLRFPVQNINHDIWLKLFND
jgi:hypothetical protein